MYASLDQLKAVIPAGDLERLTDFERTGEPSDTRLIEALEDATAVINSYIGKAVTPLLNERPRLLVVLCRDLAMHRLYLNLGVDMTAYDRLHKAAIKMLEDIADGESAIGDDGDGPTILTSPGVAMTDGPERLLTRDQLTGY